MFDGRNSECRCNNNEKQLFLRRDSCVLLALLRISVTQSYSVHKQPKENKTHQHKNQSTLCAQASPPITAPPPFPPPPPPPPTKHIARWGLALVLPTKSACQHRREPCESPALLWFTPLPKQFYKTMTLIFSADSRASLRLPAFPRGITAGVGTHWH